MMAVGVAVEVPESAEQAGAILRDAAERGARVRVSGAGTRRWGACGEPADLELRTRGLRRVVEHNAGDFTVIAEAGLPVADLQATLAAAGQRLALDPPGGGTLGGLVASGDSGPLRHRFGAARDLVIGVRVALVDGTTARAGGRVIKNVAGYDLGKLFAASFGTLGVLCEVALRLHPRPTATATAVGSGQDPRALAGAAAALARRPLEADALDVRWAGGEGAILVRFSGETAPGAAAGARDLLRGAGLEAAVHGDDEALWEAQRGGQRSADGVVARVSATPDRLVDVLQGAREAGAQLVGRAALGLAWLRLEGLAPADTVARVAALRARLAPAPCVVLDAPREVRDALDPWGPIAPATLALMRAVKARFDPLGTLEPGTFVGGV
ncbi:MAG: FAD-binding oxidoreductase [Actinomycetota bacterium]|nr:FAD-binding oxidoreductase [Actinomycetota bacterium]